MAVDDEISDMTVGTKDCDKVEYWDGRNAYFKGIPQKLTICPRGIVRRYFQILNVFHCMGSQNRVQLPLLKLTAAKIHMKLTCGLF